MADQTISMSFDGIYELAESLESLIKKYPDKAGDLLKNNAKELRKDVIQNVKDTTKTKGESKKSLAKTSMYKISPVMGLGSNQYVEISAKAPHFHLVEHGHVLKDHDGKTIGFVQGKHMMDNAIKKSEKDMPKTIENMVDELLKEGGFT